MTAPGPRRRTGTVTSVEVRRTFLDDSEPFGLRVEASTPDLGLAAWLAGNREQTLADLDRYGAIMFRGFADDGPAGFRTAAATVGGELLGYLERAAPRTEVLDRVFTSTEFTADEWIQLHHEMSYSHNWPGRLYFYCDRPAESGGGTPLASERTVSASIPAEVWERFTRHGVCYVRNYGTDLDLPWQEVFQSTDRAEVEAYCAESGMDLAWVGRDGLRTRAVRQAVARHPRTGETVWFNHAHLFHVSTLGAETAATLIAELGLDGLPRNAFYGDGAPIEDEVIAMIGDAYRRASRTFPWHRGDVLMVDNFLSTHGREPFSGARRTLVAMSDLHVNRGSA